MARKWMVAGLLLALLVGLVGWGVPWYGRYAGEQWLAKHGAPAPVIETLRWQPLAGTITLEGLDTGGGAGERFAVGQFSANLAWLALFDGQIRLQAVSLAGLDVDVLVAEDGGLQLGPVTLPAADPGAEADVATDADAEPWDFGLDGLQLADLQVRVRQQDLAADLVLGQLALGSVGTWQPEQTTALDLSARIQGAPVVVAGTVQPLAAAPGVMLDIQVGPLPLDAWRPLVVAALGKPLELAGTLALEQQVQARLADGQPQVEASGWLTLDGLAVALDGQRLEQDTLRWQGLFGLTGESPVVSGSLEAGRTAAWLPGLEAPVVQLAQWRLDGVSVQGIDDLQLAGVALGPVQAVPQRGDLPPLLQLAGVQVGAVQVVDQQRVTIAGVEFAGLVLDVQRQADGSVLLPDAVQALLAPAERAEADGAAIPDSTAAASDSALTVRLDRLAVSGDSRVSLRDSTVQPAFSVLLAPVELTLEGLDTAAPDAPSKVALAIQQNDHTRLTVDGTASPLAAAPSADLVVKLVGLDLPQLSPFVPGYNLETGRLALDTTVKVQGDLLDVENSLLLERLALTGKKGGEVPGFAKGLAMPLETALDLLRDRQGRIKLKIPVNGSLADPKVNTGDIVRRATQGALQKAAMSYVTNALQPLGTLLFVAEVAGEAAKPRFAPVVFAPDTAEVASEQAAYLAKLAELLQDRPGLSVTVCGVATAGEQAAAATVPAAPDAAAAEGGAEALEPVVDPVEQQRLQLALAEARALAVRRVLVETHDVAAERLFACQARVDTGAEAVSRVVLKL